ncbi:MAG TPA: ATP-binding protein [Streptosporangiaceae bacterium]|nr:ATP-binding protein [Streptosporangiaceae bacterium]
MNGNPRYSEYIKRDEERQIERELDTVREDKHSRAVLLYGPGGVGKTSLVRHLSETSSDGRTIWLEPIDVDDPDCWLLSNLERRVARQLDPANRYFGPYQLQLSLLPSYTHVSISHETIVSYLGRIKEIFARCYKDYVDAEQKTVVIVFDTVETIRGTNLLLTLTQWMKGLPSATVFILSGRPGWPDPIKTELESPYHGIPVSTVDVRGFSLEAAHRYLDRSQISGDLEGQEKDKLVLLTQGQPLWLAFLIDYLRDAGIPEEAERESLEHLEQNLPYGGEMSSEGERLHEEFLRRLVAPYRESDFWHEAFKRLAVVRQPVAKSVWQRLMNDCTLPDDSADADAAWQQLLDTPWIRPRGNRQYVTLHDAVAEAFAQRLFPLHDRDRQWRQRIWQRALEIYGELLAEAQADFEPELAAVHENLRQLDAVRPEDDPGPSRIDTETIERSMRLDARKREIDQLKAARLYYLFLRDFESGCQELLRDFEQAEQQHDAYFQDLLVIYLQRFLPGGADSAAFNDVVKAKLEEFRYWLFRDRPDYYIALGIMVARYLIETAQSESALGLLDRLPEVANSQQRHRMHILRGDACLRIPGKVKEGLPHFEQALAEAEAVTSADRHKLIAEAYKERGFYHRNTGQWEDADLSYKHARDAISAALSGEVSADDRNEMASIHTNWAYVKGLNGAHRDGLELVESAITVRRRMNRITDEGMSWSVCGEVYRYARRFQKAWDAYSQAERLLQRGRYWNRLGLIYQEQAICLYQAVQDDIRLTSDPMRDAKKLITRALDICLAQSIRGYPSALNRAGRIFGHDDPEAGLHYLRDGIGEAQRLSDGWFWFANLVEYAELNYRVWDQRREDRYRLEIAHVEDDIHRVAEDYSFPDLIGRWSLLQGHLATHDYLLTRDDRALDSALESYKSGFANIAKRHVGSSGAASVAGEFRTFRQIFFQLPEPVQADWRAKLRSAWSALDDGSTLLLARLEELY